MEPKNMPLIETKSDCCCNSNVEKQHIYDPTEGSQFKSYFTPIKDVSNMNDKLLSQYFIPEGFYVLRRVNYNGFPTMEQYYNCSSYYIPNKYKEKRIFDNQLNETFVYIINRDGTYQKKNKSIIVMDLLFYRIKTDIQSFSLQHFRMNDFIRELLFFMLIVLLGWLIITICDHFGRAHAYVFLIFVTVIVFLVIEDFRIHSHPSQK